MHEALIASVARSLDLDRMAAELDRSLEAASVPYVVLKGPAVTARLYDGSGIRLYQDVDILVPAASEHQAEEVLRDSGFKPLPGLSFDPGIADHHEWADDAGRRVDLHVTFHGVGLETSQVWQVLSSHHARLRVADGSVAILDDPGLCVLLALHAAHHGSGMPMPLQDLVRGLERLGDAWVVARELARELDALPAFAVGLRLVPEGAAMADEFRLPTEATVDLRLKASTPPPFARGFQRLAEDATVVARLRRVLRAVFPTPRYMRTFYPWIGRSRGRLAASYLWRPIFIAWHLIPSWRAWRAARSASPRR